MIGVVSLTGVLVSLATALLGDHAPVSPAGAGSADLCDLSGPACVPPQAVPRAERATYATPAEVDCRAAVATVAVNSRADLQLDAGACSPMTTDYRFHLSHVPESTAAGSLAPQRARRGPRPVPPDRTAAFNAHPEPHPAALVVGVSQPLALRAAVALFPPSQTARTAEGQPSSRPGRGSDPPEEPPRI